MTPDVNVQAAASRSDHPPALAAEWPVFRKLGADKALAANDVPHTWLAAAAVLPAQHRS